MLEACVPTPAFFGSEVGIAKSGKEKLVHGGCAESFAEARLEFGLGLFKPIACRNKRTGLGSKKLVVIDSDSRHHLPVFPKGELILKKVAVVSNDAVKSLVVRPAVLKFVAGGQDIEIPQKKMILPFKVRWSSSNHLMNLRNKKFFSRTPAAK